MIDFIISLFITYVSTTLTQPYLEKYIQLKTNQGYSLSTIQPQLNLLSLFFQAIICLLIYTGIRILKWFLKKALT